MELLLSPPVALGSIERQLAAASAGAEPATGAALEGGRTNRTFTLNLICRARDAADGRAALAELLALAPRHPARIFLVIADESAGHGDVEARIAPAAGVAGHSEVVCFTVTSAGLPAAASLVAPLLIGDLPVVFWWRGGRPEGAPDFRPLAALADRVLTDGCRWGLTAPALARLEADLRAHAHLLVDLTWTRLTPWRQLLCQAVESQPFSDCLSRVGAIRATSAGCEPAANLGGLLLSGWLAHQLGWQPEGREGDARLRLRRPHSPPVRVEFARGQGGRDAALESIELIDMEQNALIALRREGDGLRLLLRATGGGAGAAAPAAPAPLPVAGIRAECGLLSQELSITGRDRLFEAALASAAAMCAVLEAAAA